MTLKLKTIKASTRVLFTLLSNKDYTFDIMQYYVNIKKQCFIRSSTKYNLRDFFMQSACRRVLVLLA